MDSNGEKNEGDNTNTTNTVTQNLSHYVVHQSDHPNLILVTKVLEGDNYGQWSRAIWLALSAKNKIGFIDGTIKAPSPTDKNFSDWQRCNHMVLSWILNSVQPNIASSIIYADTAHDVWEDLKDRFEQGNDSRIYQIREEIVGLRQGNQSVSSYYTKMKSLWDELASYHDLPSSTCGGLKGLTEHEEKEKVVQFLMGLNESYTAIRGLILMMSPLPDTRKTHGLILQQERQLDVATRRESTGHMAMQTSKHSGPYTMGRPKQMQERGRTPNSGTTKKSCTHYGRDYHSVEDCYYIIGFPPGHKLHGKDVKPRGRRPNANNIVPQDESKGSSTAGDAFTVEELNQLKALLRQNNGNITPFVNTTGHAYEEDDWPGQSA